MVQEFPHESFFFYEKGKPVPRSPPAGVSLVRQKPSPQGRWGNEPSFWALVWELGKGEKKECSCLTVPLTLQFLSRADFITAFPGHSFTFQSLLLVTVSDGHPPGFQASPPLTAACGCPVESGDPFELSSVFS